MVEIQSEHFSPDTNSFEEVTKEHTLQKTLLVRIRKSEGIPNSQILKEISEKYEVISFNEILPSMNEIFIQTVTDK